LSTEVAPSDVRFRVRFFVKRLRQQLSLFLLPKRRSARRYPRAVKRKSSRYPSKRKGKSSDLIPHITSEAVTAFHTVGNQALLSRTLDQVALLAARADHPAAAIRLLGATTTLRRHIGIPARPVEQIVVDETLETARKNLTPESFKDAWGEGTRMTREQTVQLALNLRRAIAASRG
jgi:hypothetical protein